MYLFRILFLTTLLILNSCSSLSEINKNSGIWKHLTHQQALGYNHPTLRWPEEALPVVIFAPLALKSLLEPALKNVSLSWNQAAKREVVTYRFENYNYTTSDLSIIHDGKRRLYFSKSWSAVSEDPHQWATMVYEPIENTMNEADIFLIQIVIFIIRECLEK